jgi:hypothetical protein
MAGILDLPDELLTETCTFAGQQMPTLVRLSAVNRPFRSIWLGDAEAIITQVVQLFTPKHQEAIPLTRLEARCPLPTTGFHTLDDAEQGPPLRLYLPQLMRNIALASDVCCRVQVSRNIEILINPGCDLPKCKIVPLYYLTRTFLVAYHWPSLRPPLYAALQALTDESLYRFTEMCLRILSILMGCGPESTCSTSRSSSTLRMTFLSSVLLGAEPITLQTCGPLCTTWEGE